MSQKNNGSKQNPTTVIKCSFSNSVHKLLEPNMDKKTYQRWKYKKELTEKEKIEIFDKIMELHKESSELLTSYQFDKREKRRIHKARVERGYEFIKKIIKKDLVNQN
jgi:hypothetical protein